MKDTHIHVHVHLPEELTARLIGIEERIIAALQQGADIMAVLDELRAQIAAQGDKLNELGTALSEVSTDLDDLIAKLAAGAPGSQEVIDATAEATALTARLDTLAQAAKDMAGKHTA